MAVSSGLSMRIQQKLNHQSRKMNLFLLIVKTKRSLPEPYLDSQTAKVGEPQMELFQITELEQACIS